jgi:glutathione S-transferase
MTLEVYYLEETDSICSNRVIVTLAEKQIDDWIPHKMVLMNGDQFTPEYLALNPNAQVPTLVHDGSVIRESSIICSYLDDIKPDPPLKPAGLVDRAHMHEWLKLFDERGYEATAVINFLTKFRLFQPIDKLEERWKSVTNIDRLHRQQSVIREGMESPYVMRAIGAWETIFNLMEKALADGRPWIMGEQLTLTETVCAPLVKVLEMLRFLDFWLAPYPHTRTWWDRIAVRPGMQQLDTFPSNALDEDSPHAVAGRKTEPAFRENLDAYRKTFAHAY